jgi:hypothetical protein
MAKKVTVKCKICNPGCLGTFEAGENGLLSPEGCDVCLSVKRQKNGYGSDNEAWLPSEEVAQYSDGTVVTRKQAFGK